MQFIKILKIIYCALCGMHFTISCLQLLMVISVSSMPADEACNYDETSGSGNYSYRECDNNTLSSECQCDDKNLMMATVQRRFLLEWINIVKPHSISKLSIVAHELKVATDYLEVGKNRTTNHSCISIGI